MTSPPPHAERDRGVAAEAAQRARAEQLETALEDYVRRLERVGVLIDDLESERDSLTRSLADRDAALLEARGEIAHLLGVIEDLRLQNRDIVTSTSWRSTAPLRRVAELVRRSPGVSDLPSTPVDPDDAADALPSSSVPGAQPSVIDRIARRMATGYEPLVSIVVPVRRAALPVDRLECMYGQTYQNVEVILIGDASVDDSVELLEAVRMRHAEQTRAVHVNGESSGGTFGYWARGFEIARGDLVWIAEPDDICDRTFLASMVPLMADPAVMIAFSNSLCFDGAPENVVLSLEDHWRDLPGLSSEQSWVRGVPDLVRSGWDRKNIIPNVSAALFRHPGALALLGDDAWRRLQRTGDWIFYLELARAGLVAYSTSTTSLHRCGDGTVPAAMHASATERSERSAVREHIERLMGPPR